VKSVSFYFKRFQIYGVLKNVQLFGATLQVGVLRTQCAYNIVLFVYIYCITNTHSIAEKFEVNVEHGKYCFETSVRKACRNSVKRRDLQAIPMRVVVSFISLLN